MISITHIVAASLLVSAAFLATRVSAHGIVFSPPSRSYYCGYITRPAHVFVWTGSPPTYPVCVEAFNNTQIVRQVNGYQQGYDYMGFATHDRGFLSVGPKKFVCSMESDYHTFSGNITYMDLSINWPTSTINSGPYSFVWDMRWGNHYRDTEEFVYWITKPDFVYTVGMNLTWDHFDTKPFCHLPYTFGIPNDRVSLDPTLTVFTTNCTIPPRTGRHIIKAEWGRTPPTFERFHSCMDVIVNPPGYSMTTTPSVTTTTTTTSRPATSTTTSSMSRTTTTTSTTTSSMPRPTTTTSTTTSGMPLTTTTTTTTKNKTTTTKSGKPTTTNPGTTTTTTTTRHATTTKTTPTDNATTTTTTTLTTTTTGASPTPTTACAPLHGRCGGLGWTGPTCCVYGKCMYSNPYFSQCSF